jgi:hypothetical protein
VPLVLKVSPELLLHKALQEPKARKVLQAQQE